MEKDEAIRRLVFIKYLYTLSVAQSKKPEPYSWASLLSFHDTVELFLLLTAEYLDVPIRSLRSIGFAKYWDVVDPFLQKKLNCGLTQKISMLKLNDARVNFKHHGTAPSADTINSAKVNVANFLDENTALVFSIKFADISMIDLVYHEEAKINLKEAIQLLKNKKKEDAIDHIAIAFQQLIDDYIDRKRLGHWSVFRFSSFSGASFSEEILEEVESAFDEVEDALDSIEEPLRILSLGLDYRKYIRFEILTARKIAKRNKKYKAVRMGRQLEGELSDKEVQFCIDFVIESAITLKEFDFELTLKKRRFPADALF